MTCLWVQVCSPGAVRLFLSHQTHPAHRAGLQQGKAKLQLLVLSPVRVSAPNRKLSETRTPGSDTRVVFPCASL